MADVPWHLSGDYFENCSCSIVAATRAVLAWNTQDHCRV